MRWLLGGVLVVLTVVTSLVAVLVYLVPASAVERHVLASVSRATGAKIASTGSTDVTFFPSIALTLRDVAIRPRQARLPTLRVRRIDAGLDWLPLLTGWTLHFNNLRFLAPVADFANEAQGVDGASAPPARKAPSYPPLSVRVASVAVEDGRIEGLGPAYRIGEVDARTGALLFDRPFNVDIDMIVNGRPQSGILELPPPAQFEVSASAVAAEGWQATKAGRKRGNAGQQFEPVMRQLISRMSDPDGSGQAGEPTGLGGATGSP